MRRRPGWVVRSALAVGTSIFVTAGLAAAVPGHSAAAPSTPVGIAQHAPGTDASTDITLITGDVVHVTANPGGPPHITVSPALRPDGSSPQFRLTTDGEDILVHPGDVEPLIGELFDPHLFNVSTLLAEGLDDASSPTLPLIVQHTDGASIDSLLPAAEGLRLDSVNATAVPLAKTDTTGLAVARAASSSPVHKVWLDRRIEATLADSTGQIGAPAAWDLGFDGDGVRVAVLDTGIDDGHSDLSGSVAAAHDFTTEDDPVDANGHGTHVAGTIAGDGSATDGRHRGVAPGATLLNGKVLRSDGGGMVSWAIQGMEWAVEQGADIVNMSLGVPAGHPESTLLTDAVNRLGSDALFVVSAGNNACTACIGSPGDAKAALTVGAVDRNDELADFSSQGPTFDAFGLKPDVTAPGVDIVAPRATGTGEGDGPHTPMSGTSMAAPHVAGSVALLAQAYPQLSGPELKALAMTSANPAGDLFGQGSGRVNVEAALETSLMPSLGALDFGFLSYPHHDVEPVEQIVTYRNNGVEAIDMVMSVTAANDRGTEADFLTVEPTSLSIEPGETGEVVVTLDAAAATEPGRFIGEFTAAHGAETLHTAVGFELEAAHYEVRMSGIARDGRESTPWLPQLVNLETGESTFDYCGSFCAYVPEGEYSVMAFVSTLAPWADGPGRPTEGILHTTLSGYPELTVDRDVELVFDARDAVEVTVETPEHDTTANNAGAQALNWSRTTADGTRVEDTLLNFPGSQLEERFFMTPTAPVTTGSFAATTHWTLEAPAITLTVDGLELDPAYYRMDAYSDNSWQYPHLEGTRDLAVVDAGDAGDDALAGLDLDGALALVERSNDYSVADQSNAAAAAGAAFVAVYNDQPGASNERNGFGQGLEVPTVRLSQEEGHALLERLTDDGSVTVTAAGTQLSPYRYNLLYIERDGIPTEMNHVATPDKLGTVHREFTALGEHETFTESSAPLQDGAAFVLTRQEPVIGAPRTRVEFFTADSSISWRHQLTTPEYRYNNMWPVDPTGSLTLLTPWQTYRAGQVLQHQWYRGPLAPGFAPSYPVTRNGDILTVPFTGLVDAVGGFAETPTDRAELGIDSHFVLRDGDEILAETKASASGTILMPSGPGTYHLEYQVDNTSTWAELSTQTNTEWTFNSNTNDEEQVVPLMTIGYGLDLDERNTLGHGSLLANLFTVAVDHPGDLNTRVRSLALEVSFDDGQRWQRALTVPLLGGRYLVLAGGSLWQDTGYMSIRAAATDTDGNTVSQEIIRAVKLP